MGIVRSGKAQLPLTLILVALSVVIAAATIGYSGLMTHMLSTPEISVSSLTISQDGSTCTISMQNTGTGSATLTEVGISYSNGNGDQERSISWATEGTTIAPNASISYDCSSTGASPFEPFISATPDETFSVVLYFGTGYSVSATGSFS